MQQIVDELLHSVIPTMFFLYWLVVASKSGLQWRNVFAWLIYPFVYLLFILLRGKASGFYPYPLIDAISLTSLQVFFNCVGLCLAFLLLSLIVVGISNALDRNPGKG